jgi:uncharacterized protein (DUF1501 family)
MMFKVMNLSRRGFIRSSIGGASAIGIGATVPDCFLHVDANEDIPNERILIVIQLSGGNDGLNTVVPYSDDAYRAVRPKLAIATSDVLKCNDTVGLHPSLRGMRELLDAGKLAVVQSVGYDQPNRSHFESMDIWHTCRRKGESRPDGWLGRFIDSQTIKSGGDVPALHLGHEQQPFAVSSMKVRVPTVRELTEFQLQGRNCQSLRSLLIDTDAEKQLIERTTNSGEQNELLNFLQSSSTSAIKASQRVAEAAGTYSTGSSYPETDLGRKLQTIAQLIDAGLTTRIYYVQLDGFDTHAQQAATHAILLRQWSDAVSALIADLDTHGHSDRVCVMTFSEFGRRVAENASEGTDHGAAGPMFLCGGGVKGDIFGKPPSLSDLQEGDLKHQIDFRQVYATVLKTWLGADPSSILGGDYQTLPLFS